MASILSCDLILKEYSNEINSVLDIKLFKINKPINEKGLAIWLTQEYYFLLELSKLFGVCLSKSTTTSGIKTLSRAINFIREDLDFLESKIIEMKIKINDIGLMKETKSYIEFMSSLYSSDYDTLITSLWFICNLFTQALERTHFLQAVQSLLNRWNNIQFLDILQMMKAEADNQLANNSKIIELNMSNIICNIKENEINSWKLLTNYF